MRSRHLNLDLVLEFGMLKGKGICPSGVFKEAEKVHHVALCQL